MPIATGCSCPLRSWATGCNAAAYRCVEGWSGMDDDADGRKGKVGGFPPSASRKFDVTLYLTGIIHIEFDRARGCLPTHDLFPFQLRVSVDLVVAEHVAARQEGAVVLEADEGFPKRAADRGNVH